MALLIETFDVSERMFPFACVIFYLDQFEDGVHLSNRLGRDRGSPEKGYTVNYCSPVLQSS